MRRRIVGTAGHIDHGKTSLVRALTGVDTDRLPEEKRRGITIDLGFASLSTDQMQIGFVDVPGHEKFVRNMLAGVGGIDAALLVVAGDESVKPQTREHFAICRLLRIPTGVVAITKADLVEPELLEIVRLEIEDLVRGSFLDGKPVIATSTVSRRGLDELTAALVEVLANAGERDATDRAFRLPIDRAFTMKGFGSVVTGTTVSGSLSEGGELALLPTGRTTRARNIQVHGSARPAAMAGERTSINLADVPLEALHRGQQLVSPSTLRPSPIVTVEIEMLADAPPLRDQTRIRFHHFASELLGKVRLLDPERNEIEPGGRAWAQIRLEAPVVAIAGDRFVIRRYSPAMTVGGGIILDPHLGKLNRRTRPELLETLARPALSERLPLLARLEGRAGITLAELRARTGFTTHRLERDLSSLPSGIASVGEGAARRYVHIDEIREVRTLAIAALESFFTANRTAVGMPKGEFIQRLRIPRTDPALAEFYLADLRAERLAEIDGDLVHVPGRSRTLGGEEGQLARQIEEIFRAAGLMPPLVSALIRTIHQRPKTIEGVVGFLVKSGVLIRLSENVYLHRDVLEQAARRLDPHRGETADVAWFKDLYSISRKVAIPLLEYFDRAGITKRIGDRRQIASRAD
ncbi:MAG: selenocysteine-specific translation elongation factor [Thermoanaerobaculia bacterium]